MKKVENSQEIIQYLGLKRDIILDDIIVFKFNEIDAEQLGNNDEYYKDFFEIVITKRDKGNLIIRNKQYEDLNNSICFVSPRQLVNYIPLNHHKSEGISIFFKPSVFHPVRESFSIRNDFPFFKLHSTALFKLNESQMEMLYPLFQEIYKETMANGIGSTNIIRSYLEIILNKCKQVMDQDIQILSNYRYETIAYEFEKLITTHANDFKSLDEYANALNLSPVYLSECIKKATGSTAKKIVIDYQIMKIKTLLKQSNTPIHDISAQLNFNDVSNFIKFFKHYVGQTPAQFRKNT